MRTTAVLAPLVALVAGPLHLGHGQRADAGAGREHVAHRGADQRAVGARVVVALVALRPEAQLARGARAPAGEVAHGVGGVVGAGGEQERGSEAEAKEARHAAIVPRAAE